MRRLPILLISLALSASIAWAVPESVKAPNVAGAFYPGDRAALSEAIDGYLAGVPDEGQAPGGNIIMVPHAGYVFSAPVAAYAFKAAARRSYTTVVIIGPSHYQTFEGAAVWAAGHWKTPLGEAAIDRDFARMLMEGTDAVKEFPAAFDREHSVEVEVPFVQKMWPNAKIVPLLIGTPDLKASAQIAQALNTAIGAREDVLVIISSDLAHYNPYDENNAKDERTLGAMKAVDIQALWEGHKQGTMEMCGFGPVTVGLMLAQMRGLTSVQVLRHANSGDVSGDKSQVVGYAAAVFQTTVPEALNAGERAYLVALARTAVEQFVREGKRASIPPAGKRVQNIQGAFISLDKHGELRGCIGSIIGSEPLAVTVRDMAIASASEDPRFPPVTADELKDIHVTVSVLSLPKRISGPDDIVLGRDGVILSDGGAHQGVFLPQVAAETGWDKNTFLAELCAQKAGLKPNCWTDPKISLYTFTAEVFSE